MKRIYEQAATDSGSSGEATQVITKLYDSSMSRCVDIVLKPVATHANLCGESGSIGELLPLHIATIFTLPVSTLGETLETYPTTTSEPCKVTEVKTFLPAGCLPIELHDSLSMDFPKWEVEASSRSELMWSEPKNSITSREDSISRSDLLFAYNPVEPFSSDESRLQRFESRIQFEAQQVHSNGTTGLTAASKLVWIWFCTSFDSENRQGHHTNRVKKIVNTLPVGLVKELASIETPAGESVLEAANQRGCRHNER